MSTGQRIYTLGHSGWVLITICHSIYVVPSHSDCSFLFQQWFSGPCCSEHALPQTTNKTHSVLGRSPSLQKHKRQEDHTIAIESSLDESPIVPRIKRQRKNVISTPQSEQVPATSKARSRLAPLQSSPVQSPKPVARVIRARKGKRESRLAKFRKKFVDYEAAVGSDDEDDKDNGIAHHDEDELYHNSDLDRDASDLIDDNSLGTDPCLSLVGGVMAFSEFLVCLQLAIGYDSDVSQQEDSCFHQVALSHQFVVLFALTFCNNLYYRHSL